MVTSKWVHTVKDSWLRERIFLGLFKEVLVCPLLKQPSLDWIIFIQFPIFSLQGVVGKVVAWQLQSVLDETDFRDDFQSGFRSGYGTEKVLVALMDSLWQEWDRSCAAIVALLDFERINHDIPWAGFASFKLVQLLSLRMLPIDVDGGKRSRSQPLLRGVPQGSVLSI